jgi:hypothetical protein
MERLTKIAAIHNEVESLCLKDELEARGIPHLIRSNYDSAYDGLFQYHSGWGQVEASEQHKDEILEVREAIRRQAEEHGEEAAADASDVETS